MHSHTQYNTHIDSQLKSNNIQCVPKELLQGVLKEFL